jgi:hypothetical protein
MIADDFRRLALSLPGAIESSHMSHPDFRVGGKIFATLSRDEEYGVVMLLPEEQKEFLAAAPEIFSPAAGAWGRNGSTRVHLASAEPKIIASAVKAAWLKRAQKASIRTRSRRAL